MSDNLSFTVDDGPGVAYNPENDELAIAEPRSRAPSLKGEEIDRLMNLLENNRP